MRKNFCFLLIAILFFTNGNSQNQEKIDSLTFLIAKAPNDSNKVNLLFKLGKQYDLSFYKEHIENFIAALNLSKKIKYNNGCKKIYYPLISYLSYKEMYDATIAYGTEYIEFCEKNKLNEEKNNIYQLMGNVLTRQGKYDEAKKYYYKKREYDLQKEDYKSYAYTLNSLSNMFNENQQHDSALTCALWAIEIFKRNNMSDEMAGSVLCVAEAQLKKENFEIADQKANEALALYTAVNNKPGICYSYFTIASVYAAINKPDSAFKTFSKTLLYADSLSLLKVQRNCYQSLSNMYLKLKNYKDAFEYDVLANRYNDSLDIILQRGKMLELEVKYDLIKKDNEQKDQEFEAQAKNNARNFLFISLIGLILLVGLFFRSIAKKRL
jgi:tetratricopeptide (TPR) repeat protein